MKNELPQRKQLRLRNFDYNTPGAYFITICTHDKKNTLSHIIEEIHSSPEPELTEYGIIVDKTIMDVPERFHVIIDRYVIMPNHIHLIIIITADEDLRAIRESPLQSRSVISKIIGYIKMNSSREIHDLHGNTTVWQRGFYDHIIRNRHDYEQIAKYIHENPLKWQYDCFYSPQ